MNKYKRRFTLAFVIALSLTIPSLGQKQIEFKKPKTSQSQPQEQTAKPTKTQKKTKGGSSSLMSQAEKNKAIADLEKNMVFVKGGTFTMGSNNLSCAYPEHEVTVQDFYICKFEVTKGLWYAVMGSVYQGYKFEKDSPATLFSWEELEEFIETLNKKTGKKFRLPTEAEWEWAAQGGEKSQHFKYSGSDDLAEVVYRSSGSVGQMKPNELGLYDMSGNVAEICSDFYASHTPESQVNPTGPSIENARKDERGRYIHVVKGGDWAPIQYQPNRLFEYEPQYREEGVGQSNAVGLRLAMDVEE